MSSNALRYIPTPDSPSISNSSSIFRDGNLDHAYSVQGLQITQSTYQLTLGEVTLSDHPEINLKAEGIFLEIPSWFEQLANFNVFNGTNYFNQQLFQSEGVSGTTQLDTSSIVESILSFESLNAKQFVLNNQFLIPLLLQGCQRLKGLFSKSKIILRLQDDPSEPEAPPMAYCVVVVDESVEESALAKLDEFDDKWWLDNIQKGQNKLNFGIEYK